ncbi:MAG TPA: hypothetical protein VJZ71_10440 [Phycisphaerae bacterium]|nr:hypothetical protein [Phycisphaerae bacterium]
MNQFSTRRSHCALRCGLAAALIAATAEGVSAQWTVTNLHPAGTLRSGGFGVGSGQQVGYAQVGPTVGHSRASLWSGSAASWVNLHPTGMGYSLGRGADGGQQVGEYYPAGFPRAAMWTGTAASYVDLHPAGPSQSSAFGVGGGQQVGRTYAGYYRAALWSGSAASWVDLNPPPTGGYTHVSEAYAVSGGQQVGYVINVGGVQSASLWSGSAASWVNLHPTAVVSDTSQAFGTDGLQQVGIARTNATTVVNASLWSGTAASWVSLNPAGVTAGSANAVHDGQQVGRVTVDGASHASFWSGTAASWVDLHTFLPAGGFAYSEATGISHVGGITYVVGFGFNGATQREEALMWVAEAPECCTGDFDGNNAVTDADTSDFVDALLVGDPCPAPPACCPSDFNSDGLIDGSDMPGFLTKLLGGGACP